MTSNCCASTGDAREQHVEQGVPLIAIVGSPNVGKSVMFNNLTGRYVTVSNYPGTTVEVSKGNARIAQRAFGVVDTPGMYSLLPITEEERVARRILLDRSPHVVVHMVDAKALERMLPMCAQLDELGLSVVLVLNMMDEVKHAGLVIDSAALAERLGFDVVETVATRRVGLPELVRAIVAPRRREPHGAPLVRYDADIEQAIDEILAIAPETVAVGARGLALLALQGDAEALAALCQADSEREDRVRSATEALARHHEPISYRIALARVDWARKLAALTIRTPARGAKRTLGQRLSDLCESPFTGLPILAAIIYFGLYQFVGVFGAGTLVDWLENGLFGKHLNPWVDAGLARVLPGSSGFAYWTRELVGGEYGLITLGVTYAMAIVLPIVSLFFLFFSILEDSGYFPRLAMLLDRAFKRIGLNGRAVIPLVLGFGCDTMATMVTRIQETRRERIITTLLLALTIPCSAQYGVITGLLAKQPGGVLGISYAWLAWAAILLVIFLLTGLFASRIVAGGRACFYVELPPLRLPRIGNVVVKTLARMKWYFLEVLPLFLVASVAIWLGRITGLFALLIRLLEPIVMAIGLPARAAPAFLYGFFRRDFGAAGLYDLSDGGQLDARQALVACVTLTLFLPCVAQFLIMKKERGLKMAVAMSAGIVAIAFVIGGLVNFGLGVAKVSL